jgi:hypothetical protein
MDGARDAPRRVSGAVSGLSGELPDWLPSTMESSVKLPIRVAVTLVCAMRGLSYDDAVFMESCLEPTSVVPSLNCLLVLRDLLPGPCWWLKRDPSRFRGSTRAAPGAEGVKGDVGDAALASDAADAAGAPAAGVPASDVPVAAGTAAAAGWLAGAKGDPCADELCSS